jgi:hydroxyquinol 1,2-dioxygenase
MYDRAAMPAPKVLQFSSSGAVPMNQADPVQRLLKEVQNSFGSTPDARLREILQSLVLHLHRFVADVKLTHEEWQLGIDFLTAVGHKCTAERQEFMLLSDVLGISSAVDVANDLHPAATPGTVLGPYHVPDSPRRALGASLIDTDDGGERLHVAGTVRDVEGQPIANAEIDIWGCASNGLYPSQDPAQAPTNLRGLMNADAQGRFDFIILRPINYSVPMDGPVGELMRATRRSPVRAAHVHLIISAPGYQGVTTHLFDEECPYLRTDSVFSTRDSLIRKFQRTPGGQLSTTFDVVLVAKSGNEGARYTP